MTVADDLGLQPPLEQGGELLNAAQQILMRLMDCCKAPPPSARQQPAAATADRGGSGGPASPASGGSDGPAAAAAAAAAAQALALRLEAGLRQSGLLEALSGAVLAAPLPPPVPPGGHLQLTRYTWHLLLLIQYNAARLLTQLRASLGPWLEEAAVRHHLVQPRAIRLRRTALEQVAMWRPEPLVTAAESGQAREPDVDGATAAPQGPVGVAAAGTDNACSAGPGPSGAQPTNRQGRTGAAAASAGPAGAAMPGTAGPHGATPANAATSPASPRSTPARSSSRMPSVSAVAAAVLAVCCALEFGLAIATRAPSASAHLDAILATIAYATAGAVAWAVTAGMRAAEGRVQLVGHLGTGRPAARSPSVEPPAAANERLLLWPLLQPRALRLHGGPAIQLSEVLRVLVNCAAGGDVDVIVRGIGPRSSSGDPAGLDLVLPDYASAVATLAGAAEALGRRAEALGARKGGKPNAHLLEAFMWLQTTVMDRLVHDLPRQEQSANLSGLMTLQGWLLRCLVSPAVLPGCRAQELTFALLLQHGDSSFCTDPIADPKRQDQGLWAGLTPAQRAAAQEALHLSGWAPALDRALRWAAERGHLLTPSTSELAATAACYLLPATVAPSMRQWSQQERERRRQASADGGGAGEPGEGEGPPLRPWPAQEALGVLVTLAKLARREAARMGGAAGEAGGSSAASGPPQLLLGSKSPAFSIATSLLAAQPVADAGWAALAELGAGADAAEAAALAESRRRLGEVVDWCGVAAIQLATALAEEVAVALKAPRTPSGVAVGGGWTPPPIEQTLEHAARLGEVLCSYACRCSPAALEAAAPQRALAALDAVADATRTGKGAGANAAWERISAGLNLQITNAIFVLSSDQRLRHLVPGWYWPGPPAPDVDRCVSTWSVGVLSEEGGGRAVTAGAVPPRPIVRTQSHAGAALANARWPDDLDRLGPLVMAAARRSAMERGLFGPGGRQRQWAAAFGDRGGGGGGGGSWPPVALRVCGNPRCDALGAGAECVLPLKQCAGCRGVRYCCVGCQQAHWRGGHKAECGRAGAGAGAEEAG